MDCSESRDWAALEHDLVGVILNKMASVYDYLQFRLVCKSWYFVALRYKYQRSIITSKVPQLPMLIVPSKDGIQKQHSLYDLIKNETHPVDFKFCFNKRCCGSSFGWLIMLEKTFDVTLFNPFSGSVICLPPINLELDDFIYTPGSLVKAIVTKDPSLYPNDYMVVAIYSSFNKLCVMKANDKTWIYQNLKEKYFFGDVNVCNDTLYALDDKMRLVKVEVENRDDGNSSISFKEVKTDLFIKRPGLVYVVESSKREVLLVKRFYYIEGEGEEEQSKTTQFSVYKLSHECDEDGIQRAVEVESLDGDAMFIGDNQSICVSTKDFPKCLENRIYYTDNCDLYITPFTQDAGIYNLEDKSFGKHYITDPAHRNLPPPIWIVPTICSMKEEKKNKRRKLSFLPSLKLPTFED